MSSYLNSLTSTQSTQAYQSSGTGSTENTATEDTGDAVKKNDLGKEQFLELLVTQLKNQNPMEPMKNKEFMGQMAQFNSLQQMQSLNSTMEKFINYQQLTQAGSLVGKKVEVLDSQTGESVAGVIEKVNITEDAPKFSINGSEYELGSIQEVLSGSD
jgi:flagellar basal-body rod modification protein FlgD